MPRRHLFRWVVIAAFGLAATALGYLSVDLAQSGRPSRVIERVQKLESMVMRWRNPTDGYGAVAQLLSALVM